MASRQDGDGLGSIIASDGDGLCPIIASDGAAECSIIASDGEAECSIIAADGAAEAGGDDGEAPGVVHAATAPATVKAMAMRPARPAEREGTMVGLQLQSMVPTSLLRPHDGEMTVM